ncbi:OmpA family protein [Vibrio cholerae]|uniref:OmpA family protein n=2 Tax=Vibrio cholerae TaxID=666 RepID=UPI000E6C38FC|nr:OmpA family protein [Vibrio cholerae]NOF31553.1 OmpA family protein [Vibrio cholerae]RJK82861.1 hypothetical protein CHN45_17280 [Vibrio cholerae]
MRFINLLILTIHLFGCTQHIRNDHAVLDYDWYVDLLNIVYTSFSDVDNLNFWVRQGPSYSDGSPDLKLCVEISDSAPNNRFYIANITNYSLLEVHNCNFDFYNKSNLVKYDKYQKNTFFNNDTSSRQINTNMLNLSVAGEYTKRFFLKLEGLFDVYEYTLLQEGKDTLIELVQFLSDKSVSKIIIYGVADSSGSYKINRVLSEKRAKTIYQFLIERGLDPTIIDIRSGVENALETKELRSLQRRFTIEVKFNNEYH